ncbi:MAG: ATP-binding cassette domain-containing protein [Paludibacteraceae bacterium]|nr:ATP-binding cassette domain-containing protein [Paludibacteraceae bacterium]
MLLEVRNIRKKYGEQLVLDGVTLSYDKGVIVGLLGPNGAGKSTLMKIVTGYISPDEGSVLVDGEMPSLATSRIIGYLPEHNPLYLDMFVKEYLEFVGGMYKLDNIRQRVENVIDEVGLTPECLKRISQLSKGFRQRVGIAAAIMHNPRLLILDEPTTGLDPNQLVEIRTLIKRLGEQRLVIISTHIMQEVEAVCDEVVLLDHGRIVASGSKNQLLEEYGSIENLFHQVTK